MNQFREWWIATAPFDRGGTAVLGPFESRELALDVRGYVETVKHPQTFWVLPRGGGTPTRKDGDDLSALNGQSTPVRAVPQTGTPLPPPPQLAGELRRLHEAKFGDATTSVLTDAADFVDSLVIRAGSS